MTTDQSKRTSRTFLLSNHSRYAPPIQTKDDRLQSNIIQSIVRSSQADVARSHFQKLAICLQVKRFKNQSTHAFLEYWATFDVPDGFFKLNNLGWRQTNLE